VTEARAFWTIAPGRGEIRAEMLAPASAQELRICTLISGISRGTEALVFAGRVPPSQYAVMRAPLMSGTFPFPLKYGYSAVGLTDDGARMFVLHPHQDIFNAPTAMCIAVPDAVPTARAALAANMETALNVLWDAAPLAGERMMVVGAGVVGLLIAALLARIPAATVTVVDVDVSRAALAQHYGCAFARSDVAPADQELIVHASGSEAGLCFALDRAAFEARVIEASWFGDYAPAVPLGEVFHSRRLRIVASQVGSIAAGMRGRRSHSERLAAAMDLLADPRFDALLEPPTAFEDLPQAMPRILSAGLCHIITYGDAPCTV
jgi:threonine dehydrogenase-like Zn-dependent dehydrogenase